MPFQEKPKTEKSKPNTTVETGHEIYNRKKNVSDSSAANTKKTVSAEKAKSATVQSEKTKESGAFGGMKKGFLFGSPSKPKPVKQDMGARPKVPTNEDQKKKATTLEDIPFIEKKDKSETLKLDEVQETMNKTGENLLKKQGKSVVW